MRKYLVVTISLFAVLTLLNTPASVQAQIEFTCPACEPCCTVPDACERPCGDPDYDNPVCPEPPKDCVYEATMFSVYDRNSNKRAFSGDYDQVSCLDANVRRHTGGRRGVNDLRVTKSGSDRDLDNELCWRFFGTIPHTGASHPFGRVRTGISRC